MEVDLYEANDYNEEAQVRAVVSLTVDDLVKILRQGDSLATKWLSSRSYEAEFRVIVQGRKVGVNQDRIIDLRSGQRTPGGLIIP